MATVTEQRSRSAGGAKAISPGLEKLVRWMDEAFLIPGTSKRIGLDGILGLIPGVGDAATALLGIYLLREAERLGVPRKTRNKMIRNYALDFILGSVPVLGDVGDFFFKAHRKNLRLLQEHVGQANRDASARPDGGPTGG